MDDVGGGWWKMKNEDGKGLLDMMVRRMWVITELLMSGELWGRLNRKGLNINGSGISGGSSCLLPPFPRRVGLCMQ